MNHSFNTKHIDAERLHNYITDLIALDKHTLKAIEKQKGSKYVKPDEEAFEMLQLIERTLLEQIERLGGQSDRFEYQSFEGVKKTLAGFMGIVAGLIDNARKDPLSQLMRDNYTAISLITSSNLALKAMALVIEDEGPAARRGIQFKRIGALRSRIKPHDPPCGSPGTC